MRGHSRSRLAVLSRGLDRIRRFTEAESDARGILSVRAATAARGTLLTVAYCRVSVSSGCCRCPELGTIGWLRYEVGPDRRAWVPDSEGGAGDTPLRAPRKPLTSSCPVDGRRLEMAHGPGIALARGPTDSEPSTQLSDFVDAH